MEKKIRIKPEHWIPAEGISRDVLGSEIQKLLGNDATFAPKSRESVPGFAIFAFRSFTPAQIETLKERSAEFSVEKPKDPKGFLSYETSAHTLRQSAFTGYPRGSGYSQNSPYGYGQGSAYEYGQGSAYGYDQASSSAYAKSSSDGQEYKSIRDPHYTFSNGQWTLASKELTASKDSAKNLAVEQK